MSAPTSGSSGSSASPQPAASSGSPVPGYYPDPSIPQYIRYWDGTSWVPGTSRPAPTDGLPRRSQGPLAPGPALDESGPIFLDEDPSAPSSEQWTSGGPTGALPDPRAPLPPEPAPSASSPAPSWPARSADSGPRPQLPPISWGAPAPEPVVEPPRPPAPAPPPRLRPTPPPAPVPPRQAHPRPVAPEAAAARPSPGPVPPAAQASPPWAAQVQDLARGEGVVTPWKPPARDPFGTSPSQDRPGGLVRRCVARLVDTVVLAAVTAVAAVPLGTAAYQHAKDKVDQAKLTGRTVRVWLLDGTTGVQLGAVLVVFLVAGVLLEVLPTARWGRTLGKRLVGLRVLDIEAQLPPDLGASLRRWLARTVLDLLVVGAVGVAWCLFDRPWKQGLHDKAAHTFVAGA